LPWPASDAIARAVGVLVRCTRLLKFWEVKDG